MVRDLVCRRRFPVRSVVSAPLDRAPVPSDALSRLRSAVDPGAVVDLWAGEHEHGPWTPDTRSVLFSVSKGVTTVWMLMAVETGHLDLDSLVTDYWPESCACGKDRLTVRDVLAHCAGLIAPEEDLTTEDLRAWHPVAEALARQPPLWQPGSAHAYHALTFGVLAGEILRRATGKWPSHWVRERINEPLGITMTFGADPANPTSHRSASRSRPWSSISPRPWPTTTKI